MTKTTFKNIPFKDVKVNSSFTVGDIACKKVNNDVAHMYPSPKDLVSVEAKTTFGDLRPGEKFKLADDDKIYMKVFDKYTNGVDSMYRLGSIVVGSTRKSCLACWLCPSDNAEVEVVE